MKTLVIIITSATIIILFSHSGKASYDCKILSQAVISRKAEVKQLPTERSTPYPDLMINTITAL